MNELEFWQRVYIATTYVKGKSPKIAADHAVIQMKAFIAKQEQLAQRTFNFFKDGEVPF